MFLCVAWLLFSPPTASPFSSLHFGPSSVLCYPSSALILLPTGTSGSIFGWWAAEGLKHRVSQMCVVDMFAQIDCDVLHPAITSVLFSCLFWRVLACVCGTKHCCCFAGIFFFFLNQHIVSLWRLYIDQCVFDKSAIWLCMCIYVCVCLCAQYVLSSCSTLNVCFFGCFCRKAHTKINYILLKRQKMRQWVAVIEKCVFLFKNSERGITETGLWDKWDLRLLWLQPFKKLDRLDWLIQSFIVFYDFRKYGSTKKTRTVCSAKNGDLFISVSTHKSMWTFKINTAIFLKWKSKNL